MEDTVIVRGRKPKPVAMKKFEGNPGHRPLPSDDPAPRLASFAPPAKLANLAYAIEFWCEHAIALDAIGVLKSIDRAAFEAAARDYHEYLVAEDKVGSLGRIIPTQEGNLIQNPWVSIRNKAQKRWKDWLAEFGLTPSSRARLKLGGNDVLDVDAVLRLDDDDEDIEHEADAPKKGKRVAAVPAAVRKGKLRSPRARSHKKGR